MITKAYVVSVHVGDQERALDFYTNALGFEKRSDEPMGEGARWLTVAPEGAETSIFLEPVGSEGRAGGWANVIFECDDIHATCNKLRDKGVEFSEEPTRQPWGMWARFRDPDGNEFGLYGSR
ncbi:VOC family protein [Rubrobacter naiadicus]|uniref:VOC family protein n=1 Tax=Rubrobacter naiadicus TaxID=1392641 RepID=UPI002362430B|nr:VOC family protein [Rubrobacter naiadicus]